VIRYVFNDDQPLALKNAKDADPQKIGVALSEIAAVSGGHLKPAAVVEAARAPRHVLHKHFEWKDSVAAERYREQQARQIIRSVRIVNDDDETKPQAAYLSISDKGGVSYRPLEAVINSVDLQLQVLKQAERDLDAFERRYRDLNDICDLVKIAREKAAARRSAIENRPRPS